MPNIVINVPTPVSVVLVTILVALGFALVAKFSGETDPDLHAGGLPWGGPASSLVNYTIYVGLFIFLTTIGLHWVLALIVVFLWLSMRAYSTKVLHPIVDEMLERYKVKTGKHISVTVTPTKNDQDPSDPRWV